MKENVDDGDSASENGSNQCSPCVDGCLMRYEVNPEVFELGVLFFGQVFKSRKSMDKHQLKS
jgi:hypothetical protein